MKITKVGICVMFTFDVRRMLDTIVFTYVSTRRIEDDTKIIVERKENREY